MRILVLGEFSGTGGLIQALAQHGLELTQTRSIAECRALPSHDEFDLVLLERELPDGDAIQCLEMRRKSGLATPAILVAESAPQNPAALGISAVLEPGFTIEQLVDQITRLGNQIHAVSVLQIGDLSIDRLKRIVRYRADPLKLSEIEFDLLWLLAENKGKVVSTTRCLSGVWGLTHDPQSNRVSVYMKKLRAKLPNKNLIHTLRGVGYVLDPDRLS